MNERIRELAEQARKYFPKTESSGEYWVFDEEKFAELIVRECADVCQQFGNGGSGYTLSSEIREHFGVEE
jgi:hypothetical protein